MRLSILVLLLTAVLAVALAASQARNGRPSVAKLTGLEPDAKLLQPINLYWAKQSIIGYMNGQYDDDMSSLLNSWLTYWNGRKPVGKWDTVVFDIDDTILSTYPEMVAQDFGYIPKLNHDSVMAAAYPVIPETQMLYQRLIQLGYKIVFLTGRHQDVVNATVLNLERAGFPQYAQLIVRSPDQYNMTAQLFKQGQRAILTKQGYNIVGTIGDQWSDINGDYTGYRMKVINYGYYII